MRLKCHHCRHEWDWAGDPKVSQYASCPRCHYKVNVAKSTVKEYAFP